MKYDDTSWHYDGDFPQHLSKKNAATHIGMFLKWIIENDFISEYYKIKYDEEIALVNQNKITGAQFLIQYCDEKLTADEINNYIKPFVDFYYEEKYLEDYCIHLANAIDKDDSIYTVKDTTKNYNTIKKAVSDRYQQWQLNQ
ncbi:DUF7832 domain-containing protein [Nonlabens tegetincola]|uniref:DUF7832 domain-containing protein n=1 Tax=Nonlabens tegetincola TaxID=323273 RepID=UPI000CF53E5F|nr:hypothetical protein [Nonlabens tegetincola]PQJ18321.1 hypothetical protein BST93_07435 [Nonlabens tegetincola]